MNEAANRFYAVFQRHYTTPDALNKEIFAERDVHPEVAEAYKHFDEVFQRVCGQLGRHV